MAAYSFLVLLLTFISVSAEYSITPRSNCNVSLERHLYSDKSRLATELREVYDSLTACHDTESLDLSFYIQQCMYEDEPLNFKFIPGHRFPQLRELSLTGYEFGELRRIPEEQREVQPGSYMKPLLLRNPEADRLPPSQALYIPGANIESWRAAMNWTALSTLELSNIDNIFFWKMKGRLPGLKKLTVGNNHGFSNVSEYMTDFITALNPLTNLSTHGYTNSIKWSQVLDRHGKTLGHLDIQEWTTPKFHFTVPMLSIAQLEEISLKCPGLSELSVNVNIDAEIPYEELDVLASNKNLTSLTIRVRSNKLGRQFGPESGCFGCSQLYSPEDTNVPETLFIDPQAVLQIFHHLQSKKQGLELLELKVLVGNHGINFDQEYPPWVDRYNWLQSETVCSALNEQGERKPEGEAWCHCSGTCTRKGTFFMDDF